MRSRDLLRIGSGAAILASWLAVGCGATSGATCGDGRIGAGEQCEGSDLGGQGCASLGLGGGTLRCSPGCRFDLGGCEGAVRCDNGAIDQGEDCDGSDLNSKTCESLGFATGVLACDEDCFFDTGLCQGTRCGNGEVNPGEECDGENLDNQNCLTQGFESGTLGCTAECTLDVSGCSRLCGNGSIDAGEECDGSNLNAQSCLDFGYESGSLSCGPSCRIDKRRCLCPGEDSYEPNDSATTARIVQVDFSATDLVVCGDGDEDWFQTELAADATYAFTVTFNVAAGDIDAFLYRAPDFQNAAVSAITSGDNESFLFAVGADAATCYLRITRYGAPVFTQQYELSILRAP